MSGSGPAGTLTLINNMSGGGANRARDNTRGSCFPEIGCPLSLP